MQLPIGAIQSARYNAVTKMCGLLYELAAATSDQQERELLIEIDIMTTELWDLHEVIDG